MADNYRNSIQSKARSNLGIKPHELRLDYRFSVPMDTAQSFLMENENYRNLAINDDSPPALTESIDGETHVYLPQLLETIDGLIRSGKSTGSTKGDLQKIKSQLNTYLGSATSGNYPQYFTSKKHLEHRKNNGDVPKGKENIVNYLENIVMGKEAYAQAGLILSEEFYSELKPIENPSFRTVPLLKEGNFRLSDIVLRSYDNPEEVTIEKAEHFFSKVLGIDYYLAVEAMIECYDKIVTEAGTQPDDKKKGDSPTPDAPVPIPRSSSEKDDAPTPRHDGTSEETLLYPAAIPEKDYRLNIPKSVLKQIGFDDNLLSVVVSYAKNNERVFYSGKRGNAMLINIPTLIELADNLIETGLIDGPQRSALRSISQRVKNYHSRTEKMEDIILGYDDFEARGIREFLRNNPESSELISKKLFFSVKHVNDYIYLDESQKKMITVSYLLKAGKLRAFEFPEIVPGVPIDKNKFVNLADLINYVKVSTSTNVLRQKLPAFLKKNCFKEEEIEYGKKASVPKRKYTRRATPAKTGKGPAVSISPEKAPDYIQGIYALLSENQKLINAVLTHGAGTEKGIGSIQTTVDKLAKLISKLSPDVKGKEKNSEVDATAIKSLKQEMAETEQMYATLEQRAAEFEHKYNVAAKKVSELEKQNAQLSGQAQPNPNVEYLESYLNLLQIVKIISNSYQAEIDLRSNTEAALNEKEAMLNSVTQEKERLAKDLLGQIDNLNQQLEEKGKTANGADITKHPDYVELKKQKEEAEIIAEGNEMKASTLEESLNKTKAQLSKLQGVDRELSRTKEELSAYKELEQQSVFQIDEGKVRTIDDWTHALFGRRNGDERLELIEKEVPAILSVGDINYVASDSLINYFTMKGWEDLLDVIQQETES